MASRLQAMGHPAYRGVTKKVNGRPVWTGRLHLKDAALEAPLHWRKPRKIFVNSMSDLFQDGIPEPFIRRVWDVMQRTPQHIYQILTKRPGNMAAMLGRCGVPVLANVWLGTSVENAKFAGRIDQLRHVSAAVRFVSFEPLLGPVGAVDLTGIQWAIVGGESGPKARRMDEEWVEQIHQQCRIYETAFFFKQWGGVNKKAAGRVFRRRVWDEYPQIGVAAE
jgi:protein gp37